MTRYDLLLLSCTLLGWVSPMRAMQDVQNASSGNQVRVFLNVSAKDGSPVAIEKSQLNVFIDKQPAQVIGLQPAKDEPLTFAVVVDISKSDAGGADALKRAVVQVFQSLSSSQHKGYLVVFNDLLAVSRAPVQAQDVQKMLDGVKFGGGTAVYDAVERICTQELSRTKNPTLPRRAIILISDGEDNASHITRKKAEEIAEEQGVSVFSLQTRSSLAGPGGEQFLKDLSHNSGGQYINGKDVTEAVLPAVAAIDGQWALSLTPPQNRDHGLHSLTIKTSQKNIRLSAPPHIVVQ